MRALPLVLLLAANPAFARGGETAAAALIVLLLVAGIVFLFIQEQIKKKVQADIQRRMREVEAEAARQKDALAKAAQAERQENARRADEKREQILSAAREFAKSYVQGRKWLALFIAEAYAAPEEALAREMETKARPALKSADEVRRISAEKKALYERVKYLEYAIKTYHEYYPALEDYSEDILNETASLELDEDDAPDADRVARYISKEEYAKLSPAQRNQLALEKWKARKKSNVEIGRMYERYLGYLYEQDRWAVTFIGALEGLEDMGRDLLCVRGDQVEVVQAKYWSKRKTIHEKHIFQLYGTTLLLPRTHPELAAKTITPVFATTTSLSDTAQWAAKMLKVEIKPIPMDQDYPVIKCNVNGEDRIYHLPFDQQYDRVRIIPAKGEFYARTVAEAAAKGFRRAKRFYGS